MLPAAASFKKQGANKGAIASFLVSTPESGVDSIAITYALLDPIMTVIRPIAAFVTGITAGILENKFSFDSAREKNTVDLVAVEADSTGKIPDGFRLKFIVGLKYAFGDVWGDIAFWFFGGLILAGLITVFIPESLSEMVLGGGIISMLAMLLLGMPIYICATASTPIAAALLLKGASPGAVLVFLLAGPATNMTSLSVLVRILGKMGTIRYLLVIAVTSVLFGLGLDWLYKYFALEPRAIIAEAREVLPYTIKLVSAIGLIILTLYHGFNWIRKKIPRNRKQQFISGFPPITPGLSHKHAKQHIRQKCH